MKTFCKCPSSFKNNRTVHACLSIFACISPKKIKLKLPSMHVYTCHPEQFFLHLCEAFLHNNLYSAKGCGF